MLKTSLSNKLLLIFYFLIKTSLGADPICFNKTVCIDGLIIPAWQPITVSTGDCAIRSIVYFISLLYIFLGVSIISEKFMAAIERITSQEKEIEMKTKTGEMMKIRVRIWNETVSNLTLMALGSSAPEIMLSIIEVCGKNFQGGQLGPGTIVGSAAFNLFIIIGICIVVVPEGQTRRIYHINVFFITAAFSFFAYIWLYLIIMVFSKGVIDIWEAVITFLLFPVTVFLAYMADKQMFTKFYSFCQKRKKLKIKQETEETVKEFEQLRQHYMETLQDLRKKYPKYSVQSLEKLTISEVIEKSKKSRAYYKMLATKQLTGSQYLSRPSFSKVISTINEESTSADMEDEKLQRIFFEPCHYTIMENAGVVEVIVKRAGGYLGSNVYVNYMTENGTATAGADYVHTEGILEFRPNELEKKISITVIDDDVFEDEEQFSMILSNLRVKNGKFNLNYKYEISKTNRATIMILDDDHSGTFSFEGAEKHISESCGSLMVGVYRMTGFRGVVKVPYRTLSGSARENIHYVCTGKKLIFENEETFKTIVIDVLDDGQYKKDVNFFVELGRPKLLEKGSSILKHRAHNKVPLDDLQVTELEGLPKLGEISRMDIHIHENTEFKNVVDKLVMTKNISLLSASSWTEQFSDAIKINFIQKENGKYAVPSLSSYILHYLTLFWKLISAIVPPTDYLHGWLCFVVSILIIAVLTAVFGDLAASLGCTIGLLDEVVAITLVAIGTSLPDTFASKYAAINEETADSSIGNVTGSNAVNVYLGIGVAWSLASIVNVCRGNKFYVQMGSLGFSVTLFSALAVIAFIIIFGRRSQRFGGGELGGPVLYKYISASILFGLYFIYIVVSTLQAYCYF